jgi:TolB protein
MRRSALLIVIGVLAVCGADARPASEAASQGRIVFEATRTTRAGGLVVMNADGSHRERVPGAHNGSSVVVARGAYAYTRRVANEYHVIVTDAGGTRDLGAGQPAAFSPDGRTIVVAAEDGSWELRDRATGALRATFPATMSYDGWSSAGLLWGRNADLVVTQADGSGEITVARNVFTGFGAPTWSPDGAWIAYPVQNDPPGPPVLHVVRPDGSGDRAIGSIWTSGYAWSPDGARIAFATPEGHLMFATPAGATHDTGATVKESTFRVGSWSPDGTRFVFEAAAAIGRSGPLTVMSTSTDATRVVSNRVGDAAWSPDGRTLLVRTPDNGIGVVSASAAAMKTKELVPNTQGYSWLSDGRVIVFVNEEQGEQLASVAPTGGRVRFIPGTQNELEPAWSPDGTKLAFASLRNDSSTWTIAVADADGTHRHVVAHSEANAPSPSWSPDGRFIAYAGYEAIYVVSSAGGHPRRVTGAELPWTVAWSPDGKHIAFGNTPGDSDYADIVLVDPDGKHRRIVIHGQAGLNWGGVAWSPDGRTLAVARRSDKGGDPSGVPDLYRVDLPSGHQTELAFENSDRSFSPDGKQIAAAVDDGTIAVFSLAKHGGGRTLGSGSNPCWSRG